jgi:hypothetical protein
VAAARSNRPHLDRPGDNDETTARGGNVATTTIVLTIKPGRKADAEALVREVAPVLDEVYRRAGARRWIKYTHGDLWIEYIEHDGTTERLLETVTQDPQHQRLAPRFSEVIELEPSGSDSIFANEIYRLDAHGDPR